MSNQNRVGFLTIGQSPREDVMVETKGLLAANIEVVEYGLLDGLSVVRIDSLAPLGKERRLVSRLRDGRQVILGEGKIRELLPEAIEFMHREMNVGAVGVLCTHEFPEKEFSCPVIFPGEHMKSQIDKIADIQILGVVVPLENQIEMAEQKWGHIATFVVPKSPYGGAKTWEDIADALMDEKVDAVILDCIGYTLKDKDEIHTHIDVPILLPRTVLASAINRIFAI
jgi:protein AroM